MNKYLVKIISFDQPDIEGNIFTRNTKFHFPDDIKTFIKDDGVYIEMETSININERNSKPFIKEWVKNEATN